jgi:hypothetical protein
MKTKPTQPLFEHRFCSRCGGSGNYSYNQMYGTKCFKCHGSGYTLTKRGVEAQRFYRDLLAVRADEVQIGDEILHDGMFTKSGFFPVTRIAIDELNGGLILETSEMNYGTSFEAQIRIRHKKGFIREMQAKALSYQATLTKTGKVSKARRAVKEVA